MHACMPQLTHACTLFLLLYIPPLFHLIHSFPLNNHLNLQATVIKRLPSTTSKVKEKKVKMNVSESLISRSLKLLPAPSSHVNGSLTIKHRKFESLLSTVNKLVKGKLGVLGAKSVKGGVEKVFNRLFSVRQAGEQVLKASQCCLYTTAGPIQGRLFISTHKLAFCSHAPVVKVSSPDGASLGFHYKIVIPLTKIERMNKSESMKKPSQKYMQVVTTDEYEFWFTGFRSYNNTLKCLQQAISQTLI
ncbi:hypothetical protein RND81_09G197200 [Saponaria officinalis]|uniref:GRAM domain-containing protein n=1 Tax=Saponaria officinalis TaxID=3572 RepID=A0AAW1INY1_SAPOF